MNAHDTVTLDTARADLLEAELALMQQRERVAELRRALPPGPVVDDYIFTEGPADLSSDEPVVGRRLHELVGDRPLVLYHFMLGGHQVDPCPMCAMWSDGWDAVARHLAESIDFALVCSGPVTDFRAVARDRGWRQLRLLSAEGTSFKRDLGGEDTDGALWPFLSAYERDADGTVRLSYSGGAHLRDEHWRGVDLLSPVWHFLDLTRPGRGDWMPG